MEETSCMGAMYSEEEEEGTCVKTDDLLFEIFMETSVCTIWAVDSCSADTFC